jgi:hypothetical protein
MIEDRHFYEERIISLGAYAKKFASISKGEYIGL